MVRRHEEELEIREDVGEESEVEAKPRRRKPQTRLIHGGMSEGGGTALGVADPDVEDFG